MGEPAGERPPVDIVVVSLSILTVAGAQQLLVIGPNHPVRGCPSVKLGTCSGCGAHVSQARSASIDTSRVRACKRCGGAHPLQVSTSRGPKWRAPACRWCGTCCARSAGSAPEGRAAPGRAAQNHHERQVLLDPEGPAVPLGGHAVSKRGFPASLLDRGNGGRQGRTRILQRCCAQRSGPVWRDCSLSRCSLRSAA